MATSSVSGVRLAGLVSCVPERRETVADLARRFGDDAAGRIAKATGIIERRVVSPGQCTSDLAEAAAKRLLEGMAWDAGSIDLLVNVTQTRDHILPADGFLLHDRLGLRKGSVVLDLTLGCSGYVYGLWTAASLLSALGGQRALVLAGDVTSRIIDQEDRAVAPLFGDAAAATALIAAADAPAMVFDLGSDGAGAPYLMAAGGALRCPGEPPHLFMDGTQVFAFTLREVPSSLRNVLVRAGWSMVDVDHLVLHQANAQMIRHLAQKVGAAAEQTVVALAGFGNTSSASIPLAMSSELAASLGAERRRLLLSGFGVGWSWGSAAVEVGPLTVCETIVLGSLCPVESARPAKGAEVAAEIAQRSAIFA